MKAETQGESNRRDSVSQSQLVSAFNVHLFFIFQFHPHKIDRRVIHAASWIAYHC